MANLIISLVMLVVTIGIIRYIVPETPFNKESLFVLDLVFWALNALWMLGVLLIIKKKLSKESPIKPSRIRLTASEIVYLEDKFRLLSWKYESKSSEKSERKIRFLVLRQEEPDGNIVILQKTSNSSCWDFTGKPGTSYRYWVAIADPIDEDEEAPSNIVTMKF